MSFDTLVWARNARTGSVGRKAVLLVLAEYADEADSCYPSQATIAAATEQSVRTVRGQLADLEAAGLLRREHRARPDGGRTSDRYYLLRDPDPPADVAGAPRQPTTPPPGSPLPVPPGSLLPPNSQGEQPAEQPTPRGDAAAVLAAGFDRFWHAYPRATAKGDARKAWPAAVKAAGGIEAIVEGAARYAADPNRDDRFTAHASTWLRAERWADPPLPPRGTGPNPAKVRPIDTNRDAAGGRLEL
jgi:hypothetical protein